MSSFFEFFDLSLYLFLLFCELVTFGLYLITEGSSSSVLVESGINPFSIFSLYAFASPSI